MALVMLPCDLPWWPTIEKHLTQSSTAINADELIEAMQKIHELCNVSLEPDESDYLGDNVFTGLKNFLNEDLSDEERSEFFNFTLPSITQRALDLKRLRPPSGLKFSLQQICDREEFDRDFIASLLAHGFFSTFSKRTVKTHPTLQDFNFTNFFRYLPRKHQKYKLMSLFHYFNLLAKCNDQNKIIFSRQVMMSSQWLTVDDWLNCDLPLCPLLIKRQGDINSIGNDHIVLCSTRSRLGGQVLADGNSVDSIQFISCPEMLVLLLYVEALEDNEIFFVEGVFQVSKILNAKGNVSFEKKSHPQLITYCCLDPNDYSNLPLLQYQHDSILRELNKTVLGFRQKCSSNGILPKRLSPIGESFSSTPEKESSFKKAGVYSLDKKFIVLGSSGEYLPIMRNLSGYSSYHSNSSDGEFYSARTSFNDEEAEEEADFQKFSCQLDKNDQRTIFAERLKEAFYQPQNSCSDEDSEDLRHIRYDGSCGFVLDEQAEKMSHAHLSHCGPKNHGSSASSKYSFTTDYSSELGEVYEQLSRWLDEDDSLPQESDSTKAIRERAVIKFAGNLLKRTLSESFVGVPVGDGIHIDLLPSPNIKTAVRSLSLELSRHKNKLAAQLVSVALNQGGDLLPVATFNCGCSSRKGETQLKLLVQWLAASATLLPHIVYFTAADPDLNKLDTVCRVLLDRQWSVGELVLSILRFSDDKLLGSFKNIGLFEYIISNNKNKRACRSRINK